MIVINIRWFKLLKKYSKLKVVIPIKWENENKEKLKYTYINKF